MATAMDILIDVRNELKETSPAFWTNTELLRLINRGVTDFTNRTRINRDKATLSLQEGRSAYPLPANFLSARLVMHKQVVDGQINWKRVWPSNIEKTTQEVGGIVMDDAVEAQGRPRRYFIWGNDIILKPTPDLANISGSDLVLWYVAKAIPVVNLDQSIGIDDSLADAITAYVLWKAWLKEEELDRALEQKETYFEYIGQGRRFVKLQVGDERKSIDIDSPIGFLGLEKNPFDPLS